MGSLSQAKAMGGVGSILVLVAGPLVLVADPLVIVPFMSPIVSLVGFILVLVAVKYISDAVADSSIFTNMVISVIASIVGVIVAFVLVLASMLQIFPGMLVGDFTPSADPNMGPGVFMTMIAGLFILWIFVIVSAIFLRKSYRTISDRLNISMFGTAALLYLIGAITVIIFIGVFLLLIAVILQAVAFFSIEEREAAPAEVVVQPTETPGQAQEVAPPPPS
jgi:uncharacterized membrane protein